MAVICFFGRTKSGKTFKAKKEIETKKRVFIFDAACDFDGGIEWDKYSWTELISLGKKIRNKSNFKVIFRPNRHYGDLSDCADQVAKFVLAFGDTFGKRSLQENIIFVLDELDKYISISKKCSIKLAIEMGRHSNVDTFCISQVPSSLPKFIRDNATEVYAFKLGLNDFYESRLGFKIAQKLASSGFKDFFCFKWSDSNGIEFLNPQGRSIKHEA